MFGTLGGPEVILILVVALIVFGPRRLPEIGKSMGKMLAEFRKASNDFKRTIEDELEAEKVKESTAPTVPAALPAAEPSPGIVTSPVDAPPVETVAAVVDSGPPPPLEPRVEAPAEVVVSRGTAADEK
jgi:sec-independent protein translocase protein TatA